MALDEIRLTPGRCRQFVVTTTLPPPPTTTKQPTPPVTQGMFCSGERRAFIRSLHLWLECPFVFASFKAQQSKFILKGYNLPLAWAQPSVLEVVKGEYGINKREERKLLLLSSNSRPFNPFKKGQTQDLISNSPFCSWLPCIPSQIG